MTSENTMLSVIGLAAHRAVAGTHLQTAARATPRNDERGGQPSSQAVELRLSERALRDVEDSDDVPVRTELVQRVKRLIAADEYLTPERINGAVERLRRELFEPV